MSARRHPADLSRVLSVLAIAVVVIVVLYLARPVLIPLALALLLTFVLVPMVLFLERRVHLGRVPAVILTALIAFTPIVLVSWIVAVQAVELADKLPEYRQNIRTKVQTLVSGTGSAISRAKEEINQLGREVIKGATEPASDPAAPAAAAAAQPESQAVAVVVGTDKVGPWEYLRTTIAPLLGVLAGAGIVIVFVIFMLIQHEDLRDRVIRLLGQGRLSVTTQAIDDAAGRVSQYLRTAVLINVSFGIAVTVGLILIGVPNAILWGALAIPLRFIPVLGLIVSASLPIVMSIAVSDGWIAPLATLGMFVGLEVVAASLVEPWLYGARTGVSMLAILVSILFWGSLWGLPGLVLATPLTVCLVVLGRYTTDMRFLTVLLSDEPGLAPEARLYHRLLSMDQEAAYALAQQYLNEHALGALYGNVLMQVLAMAEEDQHRGMLDQERLQFVLHSIGDLVEELGEQARAARGRASAVSEGASPAPAAEIVRAAPVLCLPARDEADELAAQMLAQLLELEGVAAEAVPMAALAGEKLDIVEQRQSTTVCISAMPPLAVRHARYLVKRLTARLPELRIVVGLWYVADPNQAGQRMQLPGVVGLATDLDAAMEKLRP